MNYDVEYKPGFKYERPATIHLNQNTALLYGQAEQSHDSLHWQLVVPGQKFEPCTCRALKIGGTYIYMAFHFWSEVDDTPVPTPLILLHTLQFWRMLIVVTAAAILVKWKSEDKGVERDLHH